MIIRATMIIVPDGTKPPTRAAPMKLFTARDAKTNFGQLLDTAIREPVSITRNGRQVAVVLSAQDFERLEALQDAWWVRLAERNEEEGYLGVEESEAFHRAMLDAQD